MKPPIVSARSALDPDYRIMFGYDRVCSVVVLL
jgi:hypothetical protein